MTIAFVPLFAANLDWLEGLFVALMVLLWIGAQIRAVFRRPAPRQPPVVRPQPPVERRPPPAGGPAGDEDPREALARQIESFLRDRDGAGRPPSPRRPQRPPEPQRRVDAAPPRTRQADPARRPAAAAAAPAAAPPVGGRPIGGLGGHAGDVARHVREAFAPHAGVPTPSVARPTTAAPAQPVGGAEIVALLRQPALLRQLVVAREILDRPEHRW